MAQGKELSCWSRCRPYSLKQDGYIHTLSHWNLGIYLFWWHAIWTLLCFTNRAMHKSWLCRLQLSILEKKTTQKSARSSVVAQLSWSFCQKLWVKVQLCGYPWDAEAQNKVRKMVPCSEALELVRKHTHTTTQPHTHTHRHTHTHTQTHTHTHTHTHPLPVSRSFSSSFPLPLPSSSASLPLLVLSLHVLVALVAHTCASCFGVSTAWLQATGKQGGHQCTDSHN